MGPGGFFHDYFVKPLQTGEGYNLYNTLAYGVLLFLSAYIVLRLFRRGGLRLNRELFIALVPFVLFAGIIRALEEFARVSGEGAVPHSFLFLTPGIYFLTFALAMIFLGAGVVLKRGYRFVYQSGFLLCSLALAFFLYDIYLVGSERAFSSFSGNLLELRTGVFAWIALFSMGLAVLAIIAARRLGFGSRPNALILGGAAFDVSSVTLAALSLGYTAEQPLTQSMLSVHPLLYPAFKMGLFLGFLYFVERSIPEEDQAHWFTKLLLLVLALPMGLHNSLQVLLGV